MELTVWSNSSHITISQSSNRCRREEEKYAYYSDIQHYDLLSCTCIKANVNLMQCEENFKAVSSLLSSVCFLIDSVCCFFLRWRHVLAAIINLPWYLIKDTSPPIRNLSVCRSVCLSDNFLACQIETEGDKFVFYFLSYWRKTTRFQNLKKWKETLVRLYSLWRRPEGTCPGLPGEWWSNPCPELDWPSPPLSVSEPPLSSSVLVVGLAEELAVLHLQESKVRLESGGRREPSSSHGPREERKGLYFIIVVHWNVNVNNWWKSMN